MPYSLSRLAIWIIVAALPLTLLPHLPESRYDWVIVVASAALLLLQRKWTKDFALLLMLFLWMAIPGRYLLAQADNLSRDPIEGVVEIQQVEPLAQRLKIRMINVGKQRLFSPLFVTLGLQNVSQTFCIGQRWQMKLRLRPVHARLNEGGFDVQRYSLANSMPLTGKIVSVRPLNTECSWRQQIIQHSQRNYARLPWHAVLSALAFGSREEMSKELKTLLRETGTAHLMAISGMHIGLAAGTGWLIARIIQLAFRASWISYRFPLLAGLAVALIYSWLSGGSPPAVRALLALVVWTLLRINGRCCSNWQVWRVCIAVILFFDPLSVLSDSLWLSAMAVAGLLFWYQWFPLPQCFARKKRWIVLRLLHLQLGLFLLLMPLQVFIFHGISISALLANLWAVPVVTLLTVPLILAAIFLTPATTLSQLLWWGADRTLAAVFNPLRWLPAGWLGVGQQALIVSLSGWLILLLWRFNWWRTSPAAIIALGLSLGCWRMNVREPEWRMDMLDVGHGLAVVISRQGKAVVYDTGNKWPGGDAALSQILPWLNWQGLQVEHIVLSHGHLDHIGGFSSMQAAFPQALVHSGLDLPGHLPCHRGVAWRWQDLSFQTLWPLKKEAQSGNNQSCVLRVTDGQWRVLLTGDIEAPAELEMVKLYREALKSDLIQVPHHGSGTSSTPPLLRRVAGKAALASAARYSAWKLPAKSVISRYHNNRYRWYDTAADGQLRVEFFNKNWRVLRLRAQIMPRWYHQWFGVPRYSS